MSECNIEKRMPRLLTPKLVREKEFRGLHKQYNVST